jgi:ribA/ribD-fused uncharacterized protein
MIDNFKGKYEFLSNFAPSPMTPPTLEHWYQAAKTNDKLMQQEIMLTSTAAEAKKLAKSAKIRPDWNDAKLSIMEELLRKKFSDPTLKQQLLDTGTEELIEGNWWHDEYWGICNGKGENHLGKLLMQLRDEARAEARPAHCVGIVGHGANKFNTNTERIAKRVIENILRHAIDKYGIGNVTLVSGHSPMGGIDIWSEEIAIDLGISMDIKAPRQNTWDGEYGYKQRNTDIAKESTELHNIVVAEYPSNYRGRRFDECYHCHNKTHIKSGGCWTMHKAASFGNNATMHIIKQRAAVDGAFKE